jgi:protein-disulfide isomerase
MRNLLKCSAVLLLSIALLAQASAGGKTAAATSNAVQAPAAGGVTAELAQAYFQRMFGYNPDISVKVLKVEPSPIAGLTEVTARFSTPQGQQLNRWYVSQDLQHVIVGEVLPFGADPFAADRQKLAKSVFGPAKGPADAKMLIVEFADLECPACKEAAPLMDKLRTDFPQARFVFQSFPLPQHPWAAKAAAYLDCIGRTNADQTFTFIDSVFEHQKEIEDAVRKTGADGKTGVDDAAVAEQLRKYTSQAGADPAKIEACAATEETSQRILRSQMVGQAVGVNSTPTLFLNGRIVGNFSSAQYDAIKNIVSYEAEQAK